jgi:hypothetical protein
MAGGWGERCAIHTKEFIGGHQQLQLFPAVVFPIPRKPYPLPIFAQRQTIWLS